MPPSLAELKRRIARRGTETPEVIDLRLSRAEAEMALAPEYDHIIVNDDIEIATGELLAVIAAHRAAVNSNKENAQC